MRRSVVVFLASTAALLPATVHAQDSAPVGSPAEEVVVTASRSGEGVPVDRIGGSVTLLDAAALEDRGTRIVSDVLRDVPGVAISRSGGVGASTQARLRGTEANHVLVLIDGIEVSDPYNGEFDFGTLIADQGARIEVLRGAQSSLYGSDAIGGVIHYITASGSERPGIELRGGGGSFGTRAAAARVGGGDERFDYALSGSYFGTEGTPTARGGDRDVGADNVGASAKLNWRPADALTVTAVGRYSLTEAEGNNSGSNPAVPGIDAIVDSPGVHFKAESFYGLVRAELSLLEGRWTTAATAQFTDTDRKNYNAAGLNFGSRGERVKGSVDSTIRFGTDTLRHRLTAAVDVERERFRNTTSNGGAFTGTRQIDNVGIVGQYDLELADALALGASIRRDENDRFADVTTWRVQGSWRATPTTRLRGAYGTGVKNPGFFELYGYFDGRFVGNLELKPERSKGWEAGIEQQLGAATTIGATYFRTRLEDEIYTTYPAPAYVATPANRDTLSRQRGVEVFANARLNDWVRVDLAYTRLKARENGVEEIRRPNDVASGNVTVETPDRRFLGTVTVRYNGRQDDIAYAVPTFAQVPVTLEPYTLVNLYAEYRLTPGIAVFGRVENLLAERYEEVFSFATPGRGAFGGVKARF